MPPSPPSTTRAAARSAAADLRLNRSTLREQVFDALREAITSGALVPGSDLGESELAERYGVSRGTVREALRSLQQARLVSGDARGKLRVHHASTREIAEIFSVRSALEGLAVRSLMAGPAQGDAVATLRAALPPARLTGDFATHMNLDLAFHETLCTLSQNATLVENWRALEDRMRLVFFSSGASAPVTIMGRSHHQPIVAAIAAGDVERACETLSRHMREASEQWAPDAPPVPMA